MKTSAASQFKQYPQEGRLLSDVGFRPIITSAKDLELVGFHKQGETHVRMETEVIRRAKVRNAEYGQLHAEWLLEHQADISEEFRPYCLAFPGTVWKVCKGTFLIPVLKWLEVSGPLSATLPSHWRLSWEYISNDNSSEPSWPSTVRYVRLVNSR